MEIAYLERDREEADRAVAWLEHEGHDCHHFDQPAALIEALRRHRFDVLLLEWRAVAREPVRLLAQARSHGNGAALLVTGTSDDELAPVEALRAGADDYMAKPLARCELIARVETLARRGGRRPAEDISLGPWTLDAGLRRILLDGEPVALTDKDYELACHFLRNPGRLMSRAHLLWTIWGVDGPTRSRTVDVHVSRIRRRLDIRPARGYRIRSLYQRGYRLEAVDQAGS